jgi:hypothetical protein
MKIILKSTVSWDMTPQESAASIFRAEEQAECGKLYADKGRSGFERTNGSEDTRELF